MAVTVGLRRRLALQIDLSGVVDRNHAVVLHDDVRRIGVRRRASNSLRH